MTPEKGESSNEGTYNVKKSYPFDKYISGMSVFFLVISFERNPFGEKNPQKWMESEFSVLQLIYRQYLPLDFHQQVFVVSEVN